MKKVCIIGEKISTKLVECFSWDEFIKNKTNVADYDIVFIVLDSFYDFLSRKNLSVQHIFNQEQFSRLIFSGGEVVFLGNPIYKDSKNKYSPLEYLLPLYPSISPDSGNKMYIDDSSFQFFSDVVKNFEFVIAERELNKNQCIEIILNAANIKIDLSGIDTTIHSIASTRYNFPIACWIQYSDHYSFASGLIYLIPNFTEISIKDGILLVLKNIFKILDESPPPNWIENYELPFETQIN